MAICVVQELGLLERGDPQLLAARTHRFCPHHVSHHLGMDVHDCARAGKHTPLQPGAVHWLCPRLLYCNCTLQVITVEPGCYVPASSTDCDPRWRGIGCRVEDDILITETGQWR